MSTSLHNTSSALSALAERGISVSSATLARYIRVGVVSEPVRLATRPVWDDAALNELVENVVAYQKDLSAGHRFGAHRQAAA